MTTLRSLADAIRSEGFTFVRSAETRECLQQLGSLEDWTAFADSWNELGPDTYMADGGRYRKRRHAIFAVDVEGVVRLPAQPHYQSRDYNTLNGGIERWFQPIAPAIASSATMASVLLFCRRLFEMVIPVHAWVVEAHQFRIVASRDEIGKPTPEGLHRDGVDYVLVLLVNRTNIVRGVTSVHDLTGTELGEFTLTHPLDAAFVDDMRVMHGVTPVESLDPQKPGYRDVLVVTFRRG